MKSRSLPLALACMAAPWALFRRKAKDGWLGELEEIRGDALGASGDEIGSAMAESSGSGAGADAGSDPYTGLDPAEAPPAATTATVDPWRVGTNGVGTNGVGTNGVDAPATSSALATPTPARTWAPPPAPHREHPSQLWHAPLEMATRIPHEVAPEERVDPADLAEPGPYGSAPRRVFAPSRFTEVAAEAASAGAEGLDTFDDRVRAQQRHDGARATPAGSAAPADTDPSVDVLAGRDLVDDPDPAAAGAPPDGGSPPLDDDVASDRPRIKPPPDIFDAVPVDERAHAAATVPTAGSTGSASDGATATDGGLVDGPVGRRSSRGLSRRSLFGGGADPGAALADPADPAGPTEPSPFLADAEGGSLLPLEISASGEVIDDRGIIRLAENTRPEIVQSAAGVSFPIDAGWCWVSRFRTAAPVRVALPTAVLVVPAGTRALVVVEADHSTFVSVVSGTAHLEHPTGPVELATGSIAHVRVGGPVTLDTASPDEMAADAILTRNLRLDDALDAITRARAAEAQAPADLSPREMRG